MALYPGSQNEVHVPKAVLHDAVVAIFEACGMEHAAAAIVSASLVDADLRGIHSHGVLRVPDYTGKLLNEGVDPRGKPSVTVDAAAALVIDCGNNLGQIGMSFAMERAIARAAEINLAFAAVGGSNHAGTMEYYARMALDHDMIGICGTNALPTMAPMGGREKVIGINPMAIAIPGGDSGDFVLDIAFGATAHGKIRVFAQKGEPIPLDWALDRNGQPTSDAIAALEGLIQPIGGHKGVGLGMAIGMLSSLLSAAAYGLESGNMVDGPRAGVDGHFAMAINLAAFQDVSEVRKRVDKIIREVRGSAAAAGVQRLYTPGEIEADLETNRTGTGIPLNDATLEDLFKVADQVGADASALSACVAAAKK